MKFYWTNDCVANGYRCPNCQNMIGTKSGQMPKASKNHRIQMLDGQVKCVACNTPVGYFPCGSLINKEKIKMGFTAKILDNVDYVTPIDQEDF